MKRRTGLIFDLDGTLIDSRGDLTTAVNLMRKSYGLPPLPVDRVVAFVGNGIGSLVRRAVTDAPDLAETEAIDRMKQFYLQHLLDQTCLYPGVKAGLTAFRAAGIPLAVFTNKPEDATRTILAGLGVGELFSAIVGSGGKFPLKPAPDGLLHIVRALQIEPAASWMFGDHYTDLEAGRRAGLRRCLARYGFGEPRTEQFDAAVDSFADFQTLVLAAN